MRASTFLTVGLAALVSHSTVVREATAQEAIAQQKSDPWAGHRGLKVLYAGKEGGHREKEFGAFLERWFDKSATIPFADLSMKTAEGYDVVIVDWVSQYGNDGYAARENRLFSPPKSFGPEFTKPMISMTYVSTRVRSGYKLDWY